MNKFSFSGTASVEPYYYSPLISFDIEMFLMIFCYIHTYIELYYWYVLDE